MEEIKSIEIIPSKSDAHRAYICAALSGSMEEVICSEISDDTEATKACMKALLNPEPHEDGCPLYCRESGSTLRFILPMVGALNKRGLFHTEGRLSQRPISPLYEELCAHGMRISPVGNVPLIAEGKLQGGDFRLPGNISSQFISGLLFALPLLKEDSRVIVEGELESSGYVDMTIRTIGKFGIRVDVKKVGNNTVYLISGNQGYQMQSPYRVEGDWSNGAFWLAAGLLGEIPISVKGLSKDSAQGDKHIVEAIEKFGGRIEISQDENSVTAFPSKENLRGIDYDAAQTPDLIPVIALIATRAKGVTRIENAGRLRIKESDRLNSIAATLRALGGKVEELEEGLLIQGIEENLKGGRVDSFHDHRIVMMAAIASLMAENPVSIIDSNCVEKSYPSFFDRMRDLSLMDNIKLL